MCGEFELRGVKVSQSVIAHAAEVWVAVVSSKFPRSAMVEVAPLPASDRLFSDATPPDPFPQLLADAQVRFELASS